MEKMRRFSSCRGVSFEIKSPAIYPSYDKESTNQQEKNLRLQWSYRTSSEVFPSNVKVQKISITRSSSRPSRHFCDLDEEENNDEEEVHHDIEQPRSVSAPSKRFQQPPEVIIKRKQSRLSVILLDQGLFTVYKRLFMVCLAINVACLVLSAIAFSPYPRKHATLFSIGNILALTLCRSEAFLRVIFWLAVKVLGRPSVPLSFKTATTSFLQCLGGVHSGCGVSSLIWLVYSLVLTLKDRDSTSTAIISVASTILALLCFSCLAAFPLVRHLHHNVFERTHRFAGWTALLLVWAFIFLTISYNPITKSYDNLHFTKLMKEQEFWFTFSITIVIILPWVTVRRVPVRVSAQSGHASIIKFDGGVKAGLLGRISTSPLSEWHAFGIISDGKNEHMMLAGAVGDFTKSLVTKPPHHLWVRQVHFAGLPYLVNLYNKVLLVATGSGICVFLSFLMQPSSAEVSLLWVAKGIEQNFGKEITEAVKGFPKDKVIVHDSAVSGRPNVSQMSIDAAKKWGAEVVIVTSNPEGSRDVVNACKDAGIAAFGPIWDS